jgi:hypothetical protein
MRTGFGLLRRDSRCRGLGTELGVLKQDNWDLLRIKTCWLGRSSQGKAGRSRGIPFLRYMSTKGVVLSMLEKHLPTRPEKTGKLGHLEVSSENSDRDRLLTHHPAPTP